MSTVSAGEFTGKKNSIARKHPKKFNFFISSPSLLIKTYNCFLLEKTKGK
jgi:hypothetical protein